MGERQGGKEERGGTEGGEGGEGGGRRGGGRGGEARREGRLIASPKQREALGGMLLSQLRVCVGGTLLCNYTHVPHPPTCSHLYVQVGQHEEAETLCADALAIYERALGKDHPASLAAVEKLAAVLQVRVCGAGGCGGRGGGGQVWGVASKPASVHPIGSWSPWSRWCRQLEEKHIAIRLRRFSVSRVSGHTPLPPSPPPPPACALLQARGNYPRASRLFQQACNGYKRADATASSSSSSSAATSSPTSTTASISGGGGGGSPSSVAACADGRMRCMRRCGVRSYGSVNNGSVWSCFTHSADGPPPQFPPLPDLPAA